MSTKTLQRCEGVVLRHVNYGDADRIVSVFTAEYGVRKGFAKSARNSRKRFGASLEPFTRAVFHWKRGRGDLWFLAETELIAAHTGLRSDLDRLSLASYGVELIELLVGDNENHSRIYELFVSFLEYLDRGGDFTIARLLFELRLIYLLGYIPHLLHCSECLKIFSDEPVRFDAGRGGSLCLACAGHATLEVGIGSIGSLAKTLRVSHQQFDGFRYGAATLSDARLMLAQVLQQILPREPKSLQFLLRMEAGES